MEASTAREAASAMGVPIPDRFGATWLVSAAAAASRGRGSGGAAGGMAARDEADAANGCWPALAGAGAGTRTKLGCVAGGAGLATATSGS